MADNHDIYMYRALELAKKGLSNVAPNPMVGCVIKYKNKIIGEGYHRIFGEAHAEVNAINSVKDKSLLSKSVLYVTLEPCSHHGKTPPCSDLIIKYKIPEVIIGTRDPFKEVSGKGIEKLRGAGVNITCGVLQNECINLNKRFFTFHLKKRPYIILKWAESADGFLDKIRSKDEPIGPNWITGQTAKMLVHKWRSEEGAIICGTNTTYFDNPSLNVREWHGKNPVRLMIDRKLRIPDTYTLLADTEPAIIFNSQKKDQIKNKKYLKFQFEKPVLPQITDYLFNENINSLIVEGGADFIKSFLELNLWDEARVFAGIKYFGNGIRAPFIDMIPEFTEPFRCSKLEFYLNKTERNKLYNSLNELN